MANGAANEPEPSGQLPLAELVAGLGEATRRILEARRHLQPWADSPPVHQLDDKLRSI